MAAGTSYGYRTEVRITEQHPATAVSRSHDSVQPASTKIIAAIPCYNEEKFVGDVVRNARVYVDEVVVIDDGSNDGTGEAAKAAGAVVVTHKTNGGYGQAIKSCFDAARAMDAEVLVILDGDGQHDAAELPLILAPILENSADIVIGSRFLNGTNGVPLYRKFGINVITWLFNIGAKTKVTDAQSGFRAYGSRSVNTISLTEEGMGVSVEVLLEARRKGLLIKEVPISCKYHAQSSTLNPVTHGLGVAMTVVKRRAGL